MAGSLIKVDEFTISSPVASVILGGGSSGSSGLNASIDSTYDVYMVSLNNVAPATDAVTLYFRTTSGGTPNTTATYDRAFLRIKSDTAFQPRGFTNETSFIWASTGTGTSEMFNGIVHLFNFSNASEYSSILIDSSTRDTNGNLVGQQGGGSHTVQTACDGIQFFMSSGNLASGSFSIYGLAK